MLQKLSAAQALMLVVDDGGEDAGRDFNFSTEDGSPCSTTAGRVKLKTNATWLQPCLAETVLPIIGRSGNERGRQRWHRNPTHDLASVPRDDGFCTRFVHVFDVLDDVPCAGCCAVPEDGCEDVG